MRHIVLDDRKSIAREIFVSRQNLDAMGQGQDRIVLSQVGDAGASEHLAVAWLDGIAHQREREDGDQHRSDARVLVPHPDDVVRIQELHAHASSWTESLLGLKPKQRRIKGSDGMKNEDKFDHFLTNRDTIGRKFCCLEQSPRYDCPRLE